MQLSIQGAGLLEQNVTAESEAKRATHVRPAMASCVYDSYIYIYMCVFISIYIYIYKYTHLHIYIY